MDIPLLTALLLAALVYMILRLTAYYFLGASENLLHQGRLAEAGEKFDVILRFYPGTIRHSLSLNQAIIDAGLVKSPFGPIQILTFFTELCEKGKRRHPRNPFFPRALSGLYHQQGRKKEALEELCAAISLSPRNIILRKSLGFFHEYNGNLQEALKTYREILELQSHPSFSLKSVFDRKYQRRELASTHRSVAEILTKMNRLDESVEELRVSLEQDPDSRDAGLTYTILSQTFERMDRIEDAEKILRKGLASPFADKASLHHYLGSLFARLQRFPEAEEEMNLAKKSNARLISAYMGMAEILEEQGKNEESLAELNAALALDPGNPWLYLSLGQFFERQGDFAQATNNYAKVFPLVAESQAPEMEIIKSFVELLAHRFMGGVYFQMNRNDEAMREFKASMRIDTESYATRLFIGDILVRLGKTHEAKKEYGACEMRLQELLALNPSEVQGLLGMGDLCQRAGREQEALEWYRKALDEDPKNYNAWFGTGETYEKMHETSQALAAYSRALELAPRRHLAQKTREKIASLEGSETPP
jgi:tetratricopeptide (TPR) repeat protein